ncbi:MAG: hypothetical protein MRY83_14920 [Flavobacteriales bacterium]|nr:hypothetical protein [Flavobacteriales bacterium]
MTDFAVCSNWIPTKLTIGAIANALNLINEKISTFQKGILEVDDHETSSIMLIPGIGNWNIISSGGLAHISKSKLVTEQLSILSGECYSFGIDIWCAYHFWMYAKDGEVLRYFQWVDGEIEENHAALPFEKDLDLENFESVLQISENFGFDTDIISDSDLQKEALIYNLAW